MTNLLSGREQKKKKKSLLVLLSFLQENKALSNTDLRVTIVSFILKNKSKKEDGRK